MSAQNALALVDLIAGKQVPQARAAKYIRLFVDRHGRGQNPYDPSDPDQVDDYNAWPTNDEMGALFIKHVRSLLVTDIKARRAYEYEQEKGNILSEVESDL